MFKKVFGYLFVFTLLLSCTISMPVHAANSPIAKTVGNSNPLMDYKLGADPYALVYNGRVYIYMSSDDYEYSNGSITDNSFKNLNRVFVISSADMVNWTDHGAILVAGANGLNGGKGIAKWAGGSWAPAAAHKVINGKDKFFLYFANSGNGIGVLTADSPIGPWSDPLGKALVSNSTPGIAGVTWLFDPAVLVDDDGTGYLYCGGGIPNDKDQTSIANPKTARVIKLGTDMISTVGSASTIDAPFMFEDSGIHKYNSKYYYSYCINFAGTHPSTYPAGEIGYMMSSSPMGPFTYAGHFLKNPGAFFGGGGNNHHTVFKFNNEWYVVYHTQVVSTALYGSGKGYRSPHINKLVYNADGTIQEVKGDKLGIAQISNLDPYKRNEAETIGWNAGILTEVSQATGGPTSNLDVTNINNGDWVAVGNVNFGTSGANSFKANVASTVGCKIEIRLDSATGTLVGTLNVSSTGGAQTWKTIETNVNNATGVHKVFFVFTGSGTSNLFNFDYWQFASDTTPTNTPIPTKTPTPTLNYIYGDVNGDKVVDTGDYLLLRRYLLKIITSFPGQNGNLAADVNLDKVIDSADFIYLRKFLLHIIPSLPVGGSNPTPTPSSVKSLLDNADFENGSTLGWSPMGAASLTLNSAQIHGGSNSLKVSGRTDTWNGASQSVLNKFVNGSKYNISAWVKLDNATSDTVKLTLLSVVDGTATYTTLATGTATDSSWVELLGTYSHSVTGEPTDLAVYIEGPAAGVDFYVDDVNITPY